MNYINKLNLDKIGMCTSIFCGIHCLITPILLIWLPFAGLAFLETKGFELGLLILSIFIATLSLVFSFFKRHRNSFPLVLAGIGFVFFISGKVIELEIIEILFSVIGGGFIVLAHYRNIRLVKKTFQQ